MMFTITFAAIALALFLGLAVTAKGRLRHISYCLPQSEEGSMPTVLPRNDRWSVFSAVARWWRRWTSTGSDLFKLESCGADQIERMAQDLGLSASDLRSLVSHGAGGASLLRRRLAALHLDPNELASSEPATLRDLQRLCTMCTNRGRCARDFAKHSTDPSWQDWQDYCPNAATLNMLSTLKSCSDDHR